MSSVKKACVGNGGNEAVLEVNNRRGKEHLFIFSIFEVGSTSTQQTSRKNFQDKVMVKNSKNKLEKRKPEPFKLGILPEVSHVLQTPKFNPYSQFFRRLGNISDLENQKIQIRCDAGLNQRVYNSPSVSQVAAIWVDDDVSAENRTRDIIVSSHDEVSRIHYYFGCYDPLQYPLLFPYGETRCHQELIIAETKVLQKKPREFQTRGLPHAHFLVIMKPGSKIINTDSFDKIVSAELPDQDKHAYIFSLVVKHMMHGPCRKLNDKNICMQPNGKCKSHYPKQFRMKTECGDDSYPKYKRQDDGKKAKVRGHWLDNRWVVPYNPYLLAKFNCHINVEICSTIKAVKYLYKYVYKGHDRVNFAVACNNKLEIIDEITIYQSARWISPLEAIWRIYGFILIEIYPSVISLQLHLEDTQMITYRKKDNPSKIIDKDIFTRSMLTEENKIWTPRKNGCVIGRIVAANPIEGERYYLRLLLSHIRSPTSYDDLKIVNGIVVSSFRESALLHGLLEGDNNIHLCLEEAATYRMSYQLRQLFATILIFCVPNNPLLLWEKYKESMCEEDYIAKKVPLITDESKALQEINFLLEGAGKCLYDYGFVHSLAKLRQQEQITKMINEEKHISVSNDDLLLVETLNKEQKIAFDLIFEKVLKQESGIFFVDGPGGTVSSGVAAGILPGGRTAHSRFKIPLVFDEGYNMLI
ncbi:uncharacterized protein LOC115712305 [Cannabis sativa]|uniref:uncharacterized protein LOC115712305 n=1 Tax=Cannabis sativa TaxID=3483 RepID=UPI0029C9F77B|nr:uncharacterized protein LOC115712305 [Cannabis sativa]